MLELLWTSNLALRRRFPDGQDPFRIVARLAEECGELAAEVNHFEATGLKVDKHGAPNREHLAKEVMDVLRAALAIAEHHGVEAELASALAGGVERAVDEGLVTRAEADEPRPGRD